MNEDSLKQVANVIAGKKSKLSLEDAKAWAKRTKTADNYPAMNFGESKGLSFDRVLIYPTDPIKKWLQNHSSELAPTSRSKLYVAITRARYSVAFVYDFKDNESISSIKNFSWQSCE